MPVIVPPVHLWDFFYIGEVSLSIMPMTPLPQLMPSPGDIVLVSESLNRDVGKVSEWCELWMMKLNASKTKTMTSRSLIMHLQSPQLIICGTMMYQVWCPWYIGSDIWFQDEIFRCNFPMHLRSVTRATSQLWLGSLNKAWRIFHDRLLQLGDAFGIFSSPF